MKWKNIFAIYRLDGKKLCSNWVALIIAAGLVVLPSLYAWVNIWASWDPYGNTSGIKVGIVNEDEGAQLKGIKVTIGDEVISSLKKNHSLGWTFYKSRDVGIKHAEKGDVYATIIIPSDFSEKMCTLLDDAPRKPALEYYVNEKINAIAPKMTDKGVSTIQQQISATFIQTAVTKVFDVFNKVGVDIDQNLPSIQRYKTLLYEINDKLPDMDEHLDNLLSQAKGDMVTLDQRSEDLKYIQDVFTKLSTFSSEMSSDLSLFHDDLDDISDQVRENLLLAQSTFATMSTRSDRLTRELREQKPDAIATINDAIIDAGRAEKRMKTVLTDLSDLNGSIDIKEDSATLEKNLKALQSHLTTLKTNLGMAQEAGDLMDSIRKELHAIHQSLDEIQTAASKLAQDADQNLSDIRDVLVRVNELLSQLTSTNTVTAETVAPDIQTKAKQLISDLQDFNKRFSSASLYDGVVAANNNLIGALSQLLKNGTIDDVIQNLRTAVTGLISSVDAARIQLRTITASIDNRLDSIEALLDSTGKVLSDTGDFLRDSGKNAQSDLAAVIGSVAKIRTWLAENQEALVDHQSETASHLKELNITLTDRFAKLDKTLHTLKGDLTNKDDVEASLDDLSTLTASISELLDKSVIRMDESLIPKLERYLLRASDLSGDLSKAFGALSDDLSKVESFLTQITTTGTASVDEIQDLRNRMPDLSQKLSKLTTVVQKMDDTVNLQDLVQLMLQDGTTTGGLIASPVQIKTHKLFHIENYGAGLTPFYTVLSLWVGTLLLSALLTTKAKNAHFPFTPREEYFGKYLFFATFAMCQALVDTLGALFVLRVTVANPLLFVCLGIFYSLVFSMIVYSLVSTFSNVGKALAIVMLVFQLAGTGGTFPIQVTPSFFQALYAKLPFTYAISGMREAIGGIVYPVLLRDISMLLIYWLLFTIFGALLKKPINHLLAKYSKKLSASGIVEH